MLFRLIHLLTNTLPHLLSHYLTLSLTHYLTLSLPQSLPHYLTENLEDSAAYFYGTTRPGSYPLSEREIKEKRDAIRYGEYANEEQDSDQSACLYSRVALTVAVTLADHFAKSVTVSVTESSAIFRSPKGAEVQGLFDTPKGAHLMPRGNSESRRKNFEYNKAVNILYQSKSQTRRRSFAVSQSLHAVAPWMKKALHPEFQAFLAERLNLPVII